MFRTADTEDISQVTSLSRNSCPLRDVRDSPVHTQVAKQSNSRDFTLNMLIKEMVFCMALILTTFGALHNSPTKISKHPQAERFFSPQSVVTDWYRGQLSRALSYVNREEISFVMYYAPWDAESQYVRDEFDRAATIMHDRVHFTAINCWNPGSECRLQNTKIPSWPILMVYTISGRGVLYKGPREAHSMVKFLELIIKPLERISSTEDLIYLLSICDAVAVGFTPLSTTSKYYSVWYQTAVKSKEYDVIGEVCFATVTSEELANDLGVENTPSARLMLWNDTKEFKIEEESPQSWNETNLITWVLESFTQPVARIIPLWKKSFSFERFVDDPILILFTPLNPLYEQLPSYDLLREVAMEYYNCKDNVTSQWTTELIKLQQAQRLLYQQKDFDKMCQDYTFKNPVRKTSEYYKKTVVSHNNKYPWSNVTQKNQKSSFFNFLVKRGLAMSKLMEGSADNSDLLDYLGLLQCATPLPAEKGFYDNPQKCQLHDGHLEIEPDVMKRYWESTETSMLPFDDDPQAPNNLIRDNAKHFCKLMKFAKQWGPIVTPAKVDSGNLTKVDGLACAKNFTLNILAVDSVQNHHFAESLGIDITNRKDMTVVVILDSQHESQYVLSEPYSAKSVRNFIYNFTRGSLKRTLRSHVAEAAHTHYFGSGGDARSGGGDARPGGGDARPGGGDARSGGGDARQGADRTAHLLDLTTRTFRRVIRTPGQVTLVAACGGACGAHVTRALLHAARLLRACGVRARPARVDAHAHDLPWHYTPHTYPAVLVFSATRGGEVEESRAYPVTARLSASGIVALALRSLGMPTHLRVRLALCARSKVNTEKTSCLRELKEHVTSVIGRNLKYWQRAEDKRLKDAFLRRLYYLHQVSLELSLLHISDINEHNIKQNSLIDSLSTLSQNWDINVSLLERNITVFERS